MNFKVLDKERLKDFGFVYTNDSFREDFNKNTWDFIKNKYIKSIGYGRNGQEYLYIIDKDDYLNIYSTNSNVDSGMCYIDDTIIQLLNAKIIKQVSIL